MTVVCPPPVTLTPQCLTDSPELRRVQTPAGKCAQTSPRGRPRGAGALGTPRCMRTFPAARADAMIRPWSHPESRATAARFSRHCGSCCWRPWRSPAVAWAFYRGGAHHGGDPGAAGGEGPRARSTTRRSRRRARSARSVWRRCSAAPAGCGAHRRDLRERRPPRAADRGTARGAAASCPGRVQRRRAARRPRHARPARARRAARSLVVASGPALLQVLERAGRWRRRAAAADEPDLIYIISIPTFGHAHVVRLRLLSRRSQPLRSRRGCRRRSARRRGG